ncbi:hypothetical protein MVES_002378 [Malassezia vespertilionis]|uniref:Rad60/SUMO-like domain-containing protein n=1 Tax=Malassezia vespertilionis TaxID=2020962 RepID=A0A2N1JB41_9BASI|nr:hypothetical protein MVES_002378 [Malassezia vespertilionis]
MSEETPVPKPESAAEQLNIKVKDAEGNEVFFKVKRTTKLSKLKRAYADRMGKPENSLDMNDQDEIDAMIEQLGGW